MAVSKNNDKITQEFLETVESTNLLVDSLINELKSGIIDLVTLKTQFITLGQNIEKVTSDLDDTSDMVTELKIKVALLENSINQLQKIESNNQQAKVVDKTGKWNILVAVIASVTALAVATANIIIDYLK